MPPMTVRDKRVLLRAVLRDAHAASARRPNLSSGAVAAAAQGSGCYTAAIAAALMTLGGTHGPLKQTQELLESGDPGMHVLEMLAEGTKVPGWGSSFVKGGEDPIWIPVRACLQQHWPKIIARVELVTGVLHRAGVEIYPNASAYTAAAAMALGVPPVACASLFVSARLSVWTEIFLANVGAETRGEGAMPWA